MFSRSLIIAAIVSGVCAQNLSTRDFYEKAFYEWAEKFSVKFQTGQEFVQRLQIFADNYDMIQSHNRGGNTYTLALNQFAHLTHSEFLAHVKIGGTRRPNLRRSSPGTPLHTATEGVSDPEPVNWVDKGAVTNVKDQGQCGSCWSFSAIGALEGAYYIKNGILKSFSEQQLVSCDQYDSGCDGGWMDNAWYWIRENGGICTEASYPYTSGTTQQAGSCVTSCTKVPEAAPAYWVDVEPGSVSALESAVALTPVSIAIEADEPALQFYSSGVLTSGCGQNLDHGVLVVGYGTDNGIPYWKVKNSWGPSWGMDGYIHIKKSSEDLCGVLDSPSYPVL